MMKLKPIIDRILFERKNVGNVYHFTSLPSFSKIIDQDFLAAKGPWNPSQDYSKSVYTISTTRDRNFVNSRVKSGMEPVIGGIQICIVLDGNRMTDLFQANPYDDTVSKGGVVSQYKKSTWGDEQEELWTGPKIQRDAGIKGITRFIRKAIITKECQKSLKEFDLQISNETGLLRFGRMENKMGVGPKLEMIVDYFSDRGIKMEIE